MNNFILIANPISGKGNAKNVAEQAYTALTESGYQGQFDLHFGIPAMPSVSHKKPSLMEFDP